MYKLFALITLLVAPYAWSMEPLGMCSDDAEWPPYTYFERVDGKINRQKIVGATVDLLEAMSRAGNFAYFLELIPWQRCLAEVEENVHDGRYEVVTDASYNFERGKKYYYTKPIYVTHLGFFYSSQKFATVPVKKTTDLNKYIICSIAGYNIEPYLQAGLKVNLDVSARIPRVMLEKVKNHRCDFFITSIEPIYGADKIGQLSITNHIKDYAIPELGNLKFHFLISRRSNRGKELLAMLDKAIQDVQDSGAAEQIFKQYIPSGTGL